MLRRISFEFRICYKYCIFPEGLMRVFHVGDHSFPRLRNIPLFLEDIIPKFVSETKRRLDLFELFFIKGMIQGGMGSGV